MHCNLRSPEPRQPFPALITTPFQVEVAEAIQYCRIIAFWLLIHYCDVDLWPCDLEHLQRIACDVLKLCTQFKRNRTICGGVIAISVYDLMTLNISLHVALRSGIIFTKFDLQQLLRAWIIAYLMLIRYATLWPWPMTSWPWTFTELRMSCV